MKRYKMDTVLSVPRDHLLYVDMMESSNGEWIKWKEHNEFMIYISGILEGMGMNKKDVNDIFKEYGCLIDSIGGRK